MLVARRCVGVSGRVSMAACLLAVLAGQAWAQHDVTIVVPKDAPVGAAADGGVSHATAPVATTATRTRPMVPARTAEELAADAKVYKQHVFTLADPFMEGRAPGTAGNRRAADYVEWYYRKFGLLPGFPKDVAGEDAPIETDGAGAGSSYRQRFIAPPSLRPGDSVKLSKQEAAVTVNGNPTALVAGTDFATLGFSSSGTASGNVTFAGYAIEEGEDEYSSIPRDADGKKVRLDGKIAMVLRFEPMDDEGKSKWSSSRWSQAADLTSKIDSMIDLGATAVILVNPPGADDRRANELGDLSMGLSNRARKAPVIMLSNEAADRFVRQADPQGRSLMDLRKVADDTEAEQQYIELSNASLSLTVEVERNPLWTDNVGAILPGVGALKDQIIVVGSHYDHVGYGYFGSRSGERGRGVLHPGADDNASGTSGNLLVAQRMAEAYKAMDPATPRRTILFMGFCAEESGLNGSAHYVRNPIAPLEQHTLMFNMDMIGRLRDGKLELSGVGTGDGLADFVAAYTEESSSGMTVASKPSGLGPSDHASFAQSNVPALFAFTGLHEEYHRINDTPDTINFEGAAQVADLVYRIILDASTYEPGFPFTTATGRKPGEQAARDNNDPNLGQSMRGTGVRFGIAPGDYAGNEEGILVGEVLPNLPAEKAGLKKDDLMIRWNDKKLVDVEGWMGMLGQHKPGDEVTIVYKRDGQEFTTKATLVARTTNRQ